MEYQINDFLVHCVEMNITASYKNFFYGKDYKGSDDSTEVMSRFNCAITIEVPEDKVKNIGEILQTETVDNDNMYKDFGPHEEKKKG